MSDELVEAIRDLTRVTIAISGKFETTAEAVRTLSELSIPPMRVAAILAIDPNQVRSILHKAKKRLRVGRVKKKGASDGRT